MLRDLLQHSPFLLTGLFVNRTDGVPRYLDSPVNGNGVPKIQYPDNGESG